MDRNIQAVPHNSFTTELFFLHLSLPQFLPGNFLSQFLDTEKSIAFYTFLSSTRQTEL